MKLTHLADKKQQYKILADFFSNHHYSDFNLSMTHGFITAALSSSSMVVPSQWLPIILGKELEFGTMEEAEQITSSLMHLYNYTCKNLETLASEEFNLLLWENEQNVTIKTASLNTMEDWCHGYLLGMHLFEQQIFDDEDLAANLLPIAVFAGEVSLVGERDNHGNIIQDDTQIKEACRNNLLNVIEMFYLRGKNNYLRSITNTRNHTKIGRNELCTCGSGKKYKKCCGSPLKVVK